MPVSAAELRDLVTAIPLGKALLGELTAHRGSRMLAVAAARLRGVTVVMENLVDNHNASAVLRTCEGLGVDVMHVVEQPHRWEKNKAIARSADDWVTIKRHQKLAPCLGDLQARGFDLYAADVGPGSISVADIDVSRPVCLVFGSEHSGLSKRALAMTEHRFTVPMHGMVESFNVSVSAALSLWEVTQRRRRHLGSEGDLDETEVVARAFHYLKRAVKTAEHIAFLEREHGAFPPPPTSTSTTSTTTPTTSASTKTSTAP